MNPEQLLNCIIIPALSVTGEASAKANILLLATAAQETHCGQYVRQVGGGPGRGIFQCEPATHNLVKNWLYSHKKPLHSLIISGGSTDERLVYDLRYATWIARALYMSIPQPLPPIEPEPMFQYYKKWYNRNGAATWEQFNENWGKYVTPILPGGR